MEVAGRNTICDYIETSKSWHSSQVPLSIRNGEQTNRERRENKYSLYSYRCNKIRHTKNKAWTPHSVWAQNNKK